MAVVIFGVPMAPLGMMPNVQTVGVGGGACSAASLERACVRARELPPMLSEAGRREGAGCQPLRQKEPRRRDSSAPSRQKPPQRWARLGGSAFRRSLQAVPKQLQEQTPEGHVRSRKSFRQQMLQGKNELLANLKLSASLDTRTCLGRQKFPINQRVLLFRLEEQILLRIPRVHCWTLKCRVNEATVAWLIIFSKLASC